MPLEISPFEITMLLCFGASWPFSVHKTWKTKNVAGKSVIFLSLIIVGYLAGITHKLLYNPDIVVYLYAFNALIVSVDLALWFRYRDRSPDMPPLRMQPVLCTACSTEVAADEYVQSS